MHGYAKEEEHTRRPVTRPPEYYPHYPPSDDEISLVDLWLVLARHKWLIAAVMVVVMLVGAAIALTRTKQYGYSLALEIGTTVVDRGQGLETVLIDDPQTVLAKLKNSYIPSVISGFSEDHPQSDADIKIDASIPKGSQIVVLSGKGSEDDAQTYKQLMTEISGRIIKDHQRLMDINRGRLEAQLVNQKIALDALTDPASLEEQRKDVESQLTQAKLRLQELQDPRVLAVSKGALQVELEGHKNNFDALKEKEKMLKHRYARLDQLEQLIKGQIAKLHSEIDLALSRRGTASKSVTDAPTAMAMLVVDNEIQQNRDRLARLEERLYVGLKNQRDELDASIAENRRSQEQEKRLTTQVQGKLEKLVLDNKHAQQEQQPTVEKLEASRKKLESSQRRDVLVQRQKIDEIETRLKNMKETQAIAPAMRSPRPTGAGPALITALSVVLGLMLGIFAAFFAEFLQRVREASRSTA